MTDPLGGLTFGTAGLRGPLGEGPGTINHSVVAATAAGLAGWLRARASTPSVVIGHDARHQSDAFARTAAEVLAGAGIEVVLFDRPVPTPVLAFGVGQLAATAGVMVTASHNPATDNGIKVYTGDTTQIAAPADEEIAAHIRRVQDVAALPRSEAYRVVGDELVAPYVDAVAAVVANPNRARDLKIVYTPLHGVGADAFLKVAARAGFDTVHVVPEQASPDPDFPTVAFPNPEEPGALDLAIDLAEAVRADLVLAHDPDADRCAVVVRSPAGPCALTGDEVGALLADCLLRRGRRGTYTSSIVSSTILGRIAAAHGVPWIQTLTGFKWIGKVPDLAFGYEEALGYCVAPEVSRDKDGISAGLLLLDLADELRADGLTLLDRLDEICSAYGYHLTEQIAVRVPSVAEAHALLDQLRAEARDRISSVAIDSVEDLSTGFRGLPPTDGLRIGFAGGRVFVRPSGTEPKLKCYVEVVDDDEVLARAVLDVLSAELRDYFASATSTGTTR